MPQRRRRRPAKAKPLDYFLGINLGKGETRRAEERIEKPIREQHTEDTNGHGEDDIDSLIKELFGGKVEQRVKEEKSIGKKALTIETRENISRESRELKPILKETPIPSGDVLYELLKKPIRTVNEIMCTSDGVCRDNRKLSEIFVDEYGFRRQRGFVRTTRLPIFLDWIVEEAVVTKILPSAYKVETSRGAIALVPTNFLCELDKRYGVLLQNYDCSNYKLSITPSEKKKK